MPPEPVINSDVQGLTALQPDGWLDIRPPFEYYLKTPFCHPVKVVIQNKIAGIGTGISFGATGWLAHIIVSPEFRRQGIGSSIVDYLCQGLKGAGCETISLIATDLGYPVYTKLGFIVQDEYLVLKRAELLPQASPSLNIVQLTGTEADDVLALDKNISGEDRGKVLAGKLDTYYVYKENQETIGYYLPALGEGLIAAETAAAGIELMKVRCAAAKQSCVPVKNKEGIAFLKNNGYKEMRRARRMIWGKEFPWQSHKVYNWIAGNFG
jgi:ribosomal protein S18 acetylase RimI-like enzyme